MCIRDSTLTYTGSEGELCEDGAFRFRVENHSERNIWLYTMAVSYTHLELGTLETPIALTNTLNVGLVHDAMVEYMCRQGERRGYAVSSVNPVVCECNDASLNDIRHRAVGQAEVFTAIAAASADFAQGDVGAGKGLSLIHI